MAGVAAAAFVLVRAGNPDPVRRRPAVAVGVVAAAATYLRLSNSGQ